jgi:hypothetical protein
LSLVAQDAPFGFIAIQNNIPALFQSFSQLSQVAKETGVSVGSQLAAQFKGGAGAVLGLGLAITAVTSAITFAIQEYGSLSNALDVLFGANSNAVKAQNDFNKAVKDAAGNTGGQIAKINILVATIQNENTSQKERLAAYRELKKINPDIVAGIDEQNLATAKSIKLIGENAKAQLEYIKLQTKLSGISKALDGIEERRFQANGKYLAAREKEIKLEERLAAIDAKKGKVALSSQEKSLDAQRVIRANELKKATQEARDEISNITKEQDKWYNSAQPLIGAISKINSNTQDLTNSLDAQRDSEDEARNAAEKRLEALNKFNQLKIRLPEFDDNKAIDRKISALEKYGNIVLDTTNYDFERAAALKEIIKIDKEYFKNLDLTKSKFVELISSVESYIGYLYNLREIQKVLAKPIDIKGVSDKIDTQIFIDSNKLKSEVPAIVDLLFPDDKFNKIAEAWEKINKDSAPKLDDLKNLIINSVISDDIINGVGDTYTKVANAINSSLSKITIDFQAQQKLAENEKAFTESVKRINSAIEDGLRRPLRDFFDTFLNTGKFAFDSFVQLAKDSFKRIAADLLASGVAKLFTSLLLPGIGGAGAAGGLGGLLTNLFPTKGRAKLESLSPRREAYGGQVNFVIRGTELVGVLNRGNQEINRIG